ncbi:MAG: hypothetical protein MSH33_09445 [Fusobacterium necrophorum]|nr:hypothetical protein [Fusobacterium necrophorum]
MNEICQFPLSEIGDWYTTREGKKIPKQEKMEEYYILFSKFGFTNELISLKINPIIL